MLTPVSFMEKGLCEVYVGVYKLSGQCIPHSFGIEVDDTIIPGENIEGIKIKKHTVNKLQSVFLFKHLKMVTYGDKLTLYTTHHKFEGEFIGCDGDNEGHVRYIFLKNDGDEGFIIIPISKVVAL